MLLAHEHLTTGCRIDRGARLRDPEIGQFDVAVPGGHDVAWRNVPMHDVEPALVRADEVVREVQCPADAAGDVRGEREGDPLAQLPVTVDDRSQRRTLDELHGDEVLAGDFAQLIDLHDVAVHQVGRQLGFIDEELQPLLLLCVLRVDDLERDALREAGRAQLLGFVDGGHAADRDASHEAELARVLEIPLAVAHHRGSVITLPVGARSPMFRHMSDVPHAPLHGGAKTQHDVVDITIIGAGPTGLFGLFYAGMRGATARVVDALPQAGGQLTALYPEKYIFDVAGFPKVLAKDLVRALTDQARQFGHHTSSISAYRVSNKTARSSRSSRKRTGSRRVPSSSRPGSARFRRDGCRNHAHSRGTGEGSTTW